MILCLALVAGPVMSHEFWLEPLAYQIEPGRRLTAELINGELFAGDKVPFIPQRIVSYVVFAGDKSARVSMRVGDTPGLQQAALGEGLHVVAYQSIVATLDYPEWGKFQSFASHKDLGDLLKRHTARSLPASNFVEAYSRYSKTLIGVGKSTGADRRTGLETEIVALSNPYTDDLSRGMRVQLFYRNEVRHNAQIEVFRKAPGGKVTVTTVRTDKAGVAVVPVIAGHAYMLDAVVVREPDARLAEQTGAVWETLWANLTFGVPK